MKKTIKKADINKMIKAYNLNEDEQFYLNDLAMEIDEAKKKESKYDSYLSFIMSPYCFHDTAERSTAICAILHYFGLKVQEEIGTFFNETVEALGNLLSCNPEWIKRFFRGMSFNNPRWQGKVYVADRCGLNVLELTK